MKKILVLMVVATLMIACDPHIKDPYTTQQKYLMEEGVLGVYNLDKKTAIFAYEEESCQYAISETDFMTRIQNDAMSRVINIQFLDGAPTISTDANIRIKINAVNIGGGAATNPSVKVNVLKIQDGKIWIEQTINKVGYVLPWVTPVAEE